ncbi:IpaD/SipD/SspD family type III secretion system needle tip protein [Pandoraea pneumonica]|uniref:IpaD/SipD/SspD family type III secretion system needle tip protein n=1 Tax=Pandoraea pneumonica TaxID=2508299 RepID=UPI003CEDC8B5
MSEAVNANYRPVPAPMNSDMTVLATRPPDAPMEVVHDPATDEDRAGDVVLLAGALQAAENLGDRLRSLDREIRLQSPSPATADAVAVSAHDLSRRLKGLAALDVPVNDKNRNGLGTMGSDDDPKWWDDPAFDNGAFWKEIAEAISKLKAEYLDSYSDAADKYLKFNEAISKIVAQLSTWIKTDGKGEKVTLDIEALKAALEEVKKAFELPNPAAVLYPPQEKDADEIKGASKEDAEKWAKDLGVPESCVKEQPEGSGKYVVVIDTGPVQTMIDNVPKNGEMNPFELDIWRSGFSSQENLIKTSMQSLLQRFSTATSVYDNLVKVLSATINTTLEACKGYLR